LSLPRLQQKRRKIAGYKRRETTVKRNKCVGSKYRRKEPVPKAIKVVKSVRNRMTYRIGASDDSTNHDIRQFSDQAVNSLARKYFI
jgi:hypothetical protein